jgi:hypothetical protein
MSGSNNIPELVALQDRIDEQWAHTWIKDDSEWKILTGTTYQIG